MREADRSVPSPSLSFPRDTVCGATISCLTILESSTGSRAHGPHHAERAAAVLKVASRVVHPEPPNRLVSVSRNLKHDPTPKRATPRNFNEVNRPCLSLSNQIEEVCSREGAKLAKGDAGGEQDSWSAPAFALPRAPLPIPHPLFPFTSPIQQKTGHTHRPHKRSTGVAGCYGPRSINHSCRSSFQTIECPFRVHRSRKIIQPFLKIANASTSPAVLA